MGGHGTLAENRKGLILCNQLLIPPQLLPIQIWLSLNVRDVNSITLTVRVGLDGMQGWGEQMSLADVLFSQVVKIVADTQV